MNVLFVCVGNSARSQIAKAFFNAFAKKARAESAGTEPAQKVSSKAIEVMREENIDISRERPKLVTNEMVSKAGRVITMGCLSKESCPVFLLSNTKVEDWNLPDPLGKGIEDVRSLRDEIKARVLKLIEEIEAKNYMNISYLWRKQYTKWS